MESYGSTSNAFIDWAVSYAEIGSLGAHKEHRSVTAVTQILKAV